MRYFAHVSLDKIAESQGRECATASTSSATWTRDKYLALRHARAMAAVIRAAKAWQRGYAKHEATSMILTTLRMRLNAATKRLVAVEREVKRG